MFYDLGRYFGTIGICLLVFQILLSSRLKILDRLFGYPKILKLHKYSGVTALALLSLHPLLVSRGQLTIEKYRIIGAAALTLLYVIVITAIYTEKLKISYEVWKKIHLLSFVAIALGFIHSFYLGSDIYLQIPPIYQIWLGALVLFILLIFYKYVFKYFKNKNNIYKITKIRNESKNIKSFYINANLDHKPGQFVFTEFYSNALSKEEHHFTISSSPKEKYLRLSIKALGDYTNDLHREVKVGDKVKLDGPYGNFSYLNATPPYLFVAGGVGITPFMSFLNYMKDSKNKSKVRLIYAVKTKKDLAFRYELENLSRTLDLEIKYLFSAEKNIKKQYVNKKILQTNLKKFKTPASIFIVGPQGMIKSVKSDLEKLNFTKNKIYTEVFRLK